MQLGTPYHLCFPENENSTALAKHSTAGSGMAAHQSGWMTEETFLAYMKQFKSYAKPSEENKLLILDNHKFHISVDVINFARENHITLLSLPPCCSHELQPLDKTVFGPFKTFINQAADSWMHRT